MAVEPRLAQQMGVIVVRIHNQRRISKRAMDWQVFCERAPAVLRKGIKLWYVVDANIDIHICR